MRLSFKKPVTLRAHFDGEHIRLEEAFELRPEMPVRVTVYPADSPPDSEREDWQLLAQQSLELAYGDDEPEYSPNLIREPNPEYEGG